MTVVVDYATLKQSLIDITHRSDLTAFLDGFIQGAQNAINNDVFADNFGSGIRFMEATFTGTITSGTIGVPADWLAPKTLTLVTASGATINDLTFITAQQMYDRYPNRQASGPPAYIAREQNSFIFGPYPDSGYNVAGVYYAEAALLSGSATTNWMVLKAPLILQAAALIEAYRYLSNSDAQAKWESIYAQKLNALVLRDKSERWSSGTLAIQAV